MYSFCFDHLEQFWSQKFPQVYLNFFCTPLLSGMAHARKELVGIMHSLTMPEIKTVYILNGQTCNCLHVTRKISSGASLQFYGAL